MQKKRCSVPQHPHMLFLLWTSLFFSISQCANCMIIVLKQILHCPFWNNMNPWRKQHHITCTVALQDCCFQKCGPLSSNFSTYKLHDLPEHWNCAGFVHVQAVWRKKSASYLPLNFFVYSSRVCVWSFYLRKCQCENHMIHMFETLAQLICCCLLHQLRKLNCIMRMIELRLEKDDFCTYWQFLQCLH